jgi:hypothetical protein
MKRFVLILCVLAGGTWFTTHATVPGTVSYQGQYTDNGVLVSGDYEFIFRLFDMASGGTQVWTETKTLTVMKGFFHTELGSAKALSDTVQIRPVLLAGNRIGVCHSHPSYLIQPLHWQIRLR